ncbi:MAG: gliding motility protein GldM, partial [Bacteroidetes bacterium]
MSGVRETPRQKMIGMMYLFYTALLALQVDTAILEKFTLINKTLEHQIVEIDASNQKLFGGIESSVQDKGNRPDDKKVLDKAIKVRQETSALISELESIEKNMIEISGGLTENGALVGEKDQDAFSTYMIQQKNGRILKKQLNVYAAMLGVETSSLEDFPPIAKDAMDYDEFKDTAQRNKNFSQLFFEMTPVGAGLSSMSQLQSEVLQYETKALQLLGELVGIKDIDFDQVFPLIRPESKIVAVGGKYIAEMFIAASSSAFSPEMAVDGKEIQVDTMAIGNSSVVKYGRVEFIVSGGGTPVPGTPYKRKTFIADITLADSVYRDTVEYFTIQPVMQISSRALSALWKNCANDLSVQVPALGNAYNPVISTTNADRIMRQGRGNVTIIPTSNRSVKMTVSNSGMVIGTETFRV